MEMQETTSFVIQKIDEAQKILVGIGEEFSDTGFEQSEIYSCYEEKKPSDEDAWMLPFLKAYYLKTTKADDALSLAYKNLAKQLEGKDYFILSIVNDGRIYESGLDETKIVVPCGSYKYVQCVENCKGDIVESDAIIERIAAEVFDSDKLLKDVEKPICKECGKPMVINVHPQEKYCEEGYLSQWKAYQTWLSKTMNRQTLLMELGAGFGLPGIIRWPFEKTAFINNKAFLVRVHKELWQLTDELKEKGCSVKEDSVKFLANLKNYNC